MFNIPTLQNIPVLMKDTRRIRCCHTFVHVRPLIHIKCDIKKILIGCILRLVTFHHLDYDIINYNIIRFFWIIIIIFLRMDLKSSKSGRFGATIKWNARNSIHNKLGGGALLFMSCYGSCNAAFLHILDLRWKTSIFYFTFTDCHFHALMWKL